MPTTKKRRRLPAVMAVLLILILLAGDAWIRVYVRLNHRRLEDFAVSALEEPQDNTLRYSGWEVSCYPQRGVVEFFAGGFGLAPSSVYKGFYYSADDIHVPFNCVDQPMKIDGGTAEWHEPEGDNWGRSRRITAHWFWYEAHF